MFLFVVFSVAISIINHSLHGSFLLAAVNITILVYILCLTAFVFVCSSSPPVFIEFLLCTWNSSGQHLSPFHILASVMDSLYLVFHMFIISSPGMFTHSVSTYYFQNEESSPDLMISTGFLLADWLFSFNILLFP